MFHLFRIKIGIIGAVVALSGCATTNATDTSAKTPFVKTTPPSAVVKGELAHSVLGVQSSINPKDGSFYEVFEFHGSADQTVGISAKTYGFEAVLSLFGPDGDLLAQSGTSSDVARTMSSLPLDATYWIVVSAKDNGRGRFSLSVLDLEIETEIQVGKSVEGFLPAGGQRQEYDFEVEEKSYYAISLASDEFDTFLVLNDKSSARRLAQNDDVAGSTNSLITMELDPGSYTVVARGLNDEHSGFFILSAEQFHCNESVSHIAVGEAIETCLLPTDALHTERGTPYKSYALHMDSAQSVQINLVSQQMDSFMMLLDENGDVVAEDDDGGHALNSRVIAELQPGNYHIVVTSVSGVEQITKFQLSVR